MELPGSLAAEDRHGGVVGPDHRRLQHQGLLQRRQRLEHRGGVADPVAQRAPRQVDAVSRQDIFESIQRQVIGELADDHEGDQPGPGHAAGVGLGGTGGLATPSRHFEQAYLGRTWTWTSSRAGMNSSSRDSSSPMRTLGVAAAGAGLLGLGEVVLDADVREVLEAGASRGAGRAGSRRGRVVGRGRREGLGSGLGGEIEEMSLIRVVDAALAARAEEVAAEQGQGLEQLGVLLLEVVVVGGGRRRGCAPARRRGGGCPRPSGVRPRPGWCVVLGLLPQRVVAAEQVREEPPALGRIIG